MSFECEEQPVIIIKVAIVGEEGVGKSTFVKSLYPSGFNSFECNTKLTIGIDFYKYSYPIILEKGDRFIDYQIWVLNSKGLFKKQYPYYILGSHALFIMFDVSDLTSLNSIDYWVKDFKTQCRNSPIFLLGNKADKKNHLKIAKALADSLVIKYQLMVYYEISAIKSWNIEPIFNDLSNYFVQKIGISEQT
jgi:GTPase SAR1 family protein